MRCRAFQCAQARCCRCLSSEQPHRAFDFGSIEYWDAFHKRKAARPEGADFDWFTAAHEPSSAAWAWLRARVAPAPARVLHVGCGTSVLGEALASALGTPVLNVDASAAAVEVMRARRGGGADCECEYAQMDVTDLHLPTGAFGTVVDKGTFEALGFGGGGPLPEQRQAAMLQECARVLAPSGGRLLQISQEPPEERVDKVLGVLTGWRRSFIEFDDDEALEDACGFVYYGYVFSPPITPPRSRE